jgi:hypothetical protein
MGLSVQTVAATLDLIGQLHTSICKRGPIGPTSVSVVNPCLRMSKR